LGATTSRDAALYSTFNPDSYTIQIAGVGATTGIALAEIYDATPASEFFETTPRLEWGRDAFPIRPNEVIHSLTLVATKDAMARSFVSHGNGNIARVSQTRSRSYERERVDSWI
jgi:hypothetical protein